MEAEHRKTHSKRIGPVGCLLIGVGFCIVLLAVGVAVYAVWHGQGARQVEMEIAAIRSAGEPVSARDLESLYVAPAGEEDLTRDWLNLLALEERTAYHEESKSLPLVGVVNDWIPPPGTPWQQLAEAEAFLHRYRGNTEGIHDLARQNGAVRYPLQFDQLISMPLPHIQQLRGTARLLALEAHVRAHQGDAHGAAESIHAINRLAATLAQEPVPVSQLVRISLVRVSFAHFHQLLPHIEFADDDLRQLSDDYEAAQCARALETSLLFGRVMGMQAFATPQLADGNLPGTVSAVRNEDLALYLRLMSRLVVASRSPYVVAQGQFALVQQELTASFDTDLGRFRYRGTRFLMPAAGSMLGSFTEGEAHGRCAVATIALKRFQQDNGHFPAELKQLVPDYLPALPIDPFHGKTLRYSARDDGYTLYSIGRNGVDDGGNDDDCAWNIELPDK